MSTNYGSNKPLTASIEDRFIFKIRDRWAELAKAQPVNPWAVCTSSVGRADKEKYERCVQDVKKEHPIAKSDDDERERIKRRVEKLNSGDPDIEDKKREAREERSIAKSIERLIVAAEAISKAADSEEAGGAQGRRGGRLPGRVTGAHWQMWQQYGQLGRQAASTDPGTLISTPGSAVSAEVYGHQTRKYIKQRQQDLQERAKLRQQREEDQAAARKQRAATEAQQQKDREAARGAATKSLLEAIDILKAISLQKKEKMLEGNLGVPREQMPQIRSYHVDSFVKEMKGKGVKVSRGPSKAVGKLKAAQNELSDTGIERQLNTPMKERKKKPIIVSKDNYVLDGHHRWAASHHENPRQKLNQVKVHMPIRKLIDAANKFSKVEHASVDTPFDS